MIVRFWLNLWLTFLLKFSYCAEILLNYSVFITFWALKKQTVGYYFYKKKIVDEIQLSLSV